PHRYRALGTLPRTLFGAGGGGRSTVAFVRNRWVILSISMVAQVASVSAMFGVPIVLPQLRVDFGVTTAQAGVLAGLPSFGLLLTLLLWGLVIDRAGERWTMTLSLLLTA